MTSTYFTLVQQLVSHPRRLRFDVRGLPTADPASSFVENSFVVLKPHLFAGFRRKQLPERFILVVDLEIFLLIGRSYLVGAKEKTVRMSIDDGRCVLRRFRRRHDVLRHLVP